jgi:hypothetical protein
MNLQVPLNMEISLLVEELLAFQEGLCSMELVIWLSTGVLRSTSSTVMFYTNEQEYPILQVISIVDY